MGVQTYSALLLFPKVAWSATHLGFCSFWTFRCTNYAREFDSGTYIICLTRMRFGELDLLALLPFGPKAIRARVYRFSVSFCLAGNIRQPSEKRAVVKYSYPSDVLIINKSSK